MFKNYFITAIRVLSANKAFGLINISGLTIGLAVFILISMFVQYELNYDNGYVDSGNIYRVERSFLNGEQPSFDLATNAPTVAKLITNDFDVVMASTRLARDSISISIEDLNLVEEHLFVADENFFDFFGLEFLEGDQKSALKNPSSIVLSESTAKRYFGNVSPLGKSLLMGGKHIANVSGVFKDLPKNTHLKINAITHINLIESMFGPSALVNWGANSYYTYIKVKPGTDIGELESQFPSFLQRHLGESAPEWTRITLRKLTDIHLFSNKQMELSANGSISTVLTFTAIAFSVLIIACINFMNLSTARSIMRAKEVGVRKTLGAKRNALIIQFLCESTLLAFVAVVIGVCVVFWLLPHFAGLVERELVFFDYVNASGLFFIVFCTLFVGIVAGSYPAFYLSKFNVVEVLNGQTSGSNSANFARKILVVFQFSISVVLVISTFIVFAQMHYITNKDLGYDEKNVLISTLPRTDNLWQLYLPLKQKLEGLDHVESVSLSSVVPSADLLDGSGYIAADSPMTQEYVKDIRDVGVDYKFFELFGIDLVAGRLFGEDFNDRTVIRPTEANPHGSGNIIVNEEAVRALGFTSAAEAINKVIIQPLAPKLSSTMRWTIVGVVEDVYFSSLRVGKSPIAYSPLGSGAVPVMSVRYEPGYSSQISSDVTIAMQEIAPTLALTNEYLEERLSALYKDERTLSIVFAAFSVLTIFVALLGLYGLVSFATERRSKEIAIRKVLGAKVINIVTLISKDFIVLILIGNVLAWPVAYMAVSTWLSSFTYATSISALYFIFATIIVSIIALTTIALKTAITASSKPVKALRSD